MNVVPSGTVLNQVDRENFSAGGVQDEGAEGVVGRVDAQPCGVQRFDIQCRGHGRKIGIGIEELIIPRSDAPEGGDFLVAQVAIDDTAITHQYIQRPAVVCQVAYPKAGVTVGGWAAVIWDLQKVQPAGSFDNCDGGQSVYLERHGFLQINPAVDSHNGYDLITRANPAVAADRGIVQTIDKPVVVYRNAEGGVIVGGV